MPAGSPRVIRMRGMGEHWQGVRCCQAVKCGRV
jgi:hypothetical protein